MSQQLESWDIGRLIPYEKNAKKHTPEKINKLANAIREFGWDQPIVVDKDGVIIKGHGRRLAALQLGMTKVPVLVRRDLTPEQVKAARLSDNRVAYGEIDADLLQEELRSLQSAAFDLGVIGFDEKELSFLTEELTEMDLDSLVEDLNAEVNEQAQAGDRHVKDAKERTVKLQEAFGFSGFTIEQARVVTRFMSQLESESGKSGAEALVEFVQGLVEASWN
ncbi:ParB/Srx family N-terminal domain-containing protein [Ectothiorhodospira shaposhnikovii]|uniref:ParB/Srx family N-terminal domain-containing protein n=1 Tax=Ectothiorhodospira shaposhnikovii TaxID=1054 RepID=UPI001EE7F4AE|nr:ParB/Srx family N-terminal domain-containing protein [Ectothiorhodospira shaposhnikovii]MCG5512841.1 ParB/Srx family N-terminal domain-containing protein [Ectothiorhodospira shaposhnikovii]